MHSLVIHQYNPTDRRLGRHVNHDSRSWQYRHARTAVKLSNHRWPRNVPVFDQGNLGSCTGNAALGNCGTGEAYSAIRANNVAVSFVEGTAVSVYAQATKEDPYSGEYPPDDTGSDGLTVAKVCQERHWINGYTHAMGIDDALDALQTSAFITGTNWLSNMFDPAPDGKLNVSGGLAGGHEYIIDEIDVTNERVWMQNSWGEEWGLNGRAYFTFKDYELLLQDGGDVTIFTPLSVPAPVPVPPTDGKQFIRDWLDEHHFFYKDFQAKLRTYVST